MNRPNQLYSPNRFSKYSKKYTLNPNDTDTSATQKNAWTNKCTPTVCLIKLGSQTGKETPQQGRNDAATAPTTTPTTTQKKHKTMPP
jgi:hypothetical protein